MVGEGAAAGTEGSGLREEAAAAGSSNAGYSFQVASDAAVQAFSKDKRGAPAPPGPGPWLWGGLLNPTLSSTGSSARCEEARLSQVSPDPTFVFGAVGCSPAPSPQSPSAPPPGPPRGHPPASRGVGGGRDH